ncbi:MAG: type II and III secretion system protein family protein [Pseudomonadota bacterium]
MTNTFRLKVLLAALLGVMMMSHDAESASRPRPAPAKETAPASDEQGGGTRIVGGPRARLIKMQISKSLILELPGIAKDILVSNPKIADVTVRSQSRVFLIGNAVGSTNIFFFDENSRQIAAIDLVVERDLEGLNRTLQSVFPNTNVHAEGVGDNVILSGSINSAVDAQTAVDIANKFLSQSDTSSASSSSDPASKAASVGSSSSAGDKGVVNALKILGKDQVQLRVVIAEVNRDALKQIGVDLNGSRLGSNYTTGTTAGATNVTGSGLSYGPNRNEIGTGNLGSLEGAAGLAAMFAMPLTNMPGKINATAQIKALEQTGLSKILAEPTLTAISGEEAKFLAGGQFPYIQSTSATGGPSYGFKDFGVGLAFNPIVLSEGRISVRVKTEVSELNTNYSVGGVPGVDVRSAETVLELPSGGSMMIAGLIRDTTKMSVNGIPGLRKLPILGRLFSSQQFISNQTELVVVVTPYIVNPVSRKEIALPTDGFVNASEPDALLWGRFNKVYGSGGRAPSTPYHGNIGFIYE